MIGGEIIAHFSKRSGRLFLSADGADVKSASALLGHRQTSTTLNFYAHAVQQTNEKALNRVASLLSTA